MTALRMTRAGRLGWGLTVTLVVTCLANCSSNLVNGDAGGAGGTGGIATGGSDGGNAGVGGGVTLDGGDAGGCAFGVPGFDPTAACAAPPSAQVPYTDAKSLASLIVGDWLRCEGPIQPVGMPVAPDGQDGIEFDVNPGEQQGQAGGLMPSGGPCLNQVLLYDGSEHYAPTSWAFASTSTGPGIVFQDTFGDVVYDNAVFSSGGKRMVLSDPTYNGTYIRR